VRSFAAALPLMGLALAWALGGSSSALCASGGDAVEVAPPVVQGAEDAVAAGVVSAAAQDVQTPEQLVSGTETVLESGSESPVYHLRPEPYSDAEALQITLDDLLELSVVNNIGLKLQNYIIEKGHYSVDQTYYAFDPQVSASLSYNKSNPGGGAPVTASGVLGSESATAGVKYTVPREYGDAFQFSYDVSRSKFNLFGTGEGTTTPLTYGGSLDIGYTRPLARGAGKYINRIPRFLASNILQLSYDKLDDDCRKLKKSVLDVYFQAVAARQSISVREASLDLALKQLERAVERYKVGLAIQADVLQAENSVLTQRSQLLTARSTYQSLLDQMTTIIGLPQEYKLGIDADGALIDLGSRLPEDLWVLVQANSFDLKSLNVQLANLRLSRDQQLDKLKPQLGLSVSYGRVGSDSNLGVAATGLEDESYSVALNWAKTPGERATKAQLAQSDIDLASTELSIQDTELQLKTALRTAQRDLETKFEQIGLAENNVKVLEETYNIQLERNSVGLATMLDVIDAEEKLLGAQLALLQARVSYQERYRQIQLLAGVI